MTAPTPFLFDPPPKYFLPLAKGGDLAVDFQNNPSGDQDTLVAYEPGVNVTLFLDTTPLIAVVAVVSGAHAHIKLESAIADTVPAGTDWRVIVSYPTTPSTEVVGAYGTVKRFGD